MIETGTKTYIKKRIWKMKWDCGMIVGHAGATEKE